jgi:membrane fusion protein (multidrug efflux system)
MASPDKLRRRGRARSAEAWADTKPRALGSAAPKPAEIEDKQDAVTRLLGGGVASPARHRLRSVWRRARWGLLALAAAGLLSPVFLWMNYRSLHVTSKNAAVRGHLAEIGSRVNGLVTKVEVDVGDRVTAGQVLVRLEDRHLLAEVQEARAEIEGLTRGIEVERLAIGLERRQIRQQEQEAIAKVVAADAQTEAAKIRAADARRDHELRESLFARDGVVSAEDVREADSGRRTAEALLEEAKANSVVAQSAEQKVQLADDAVSIRERKVRVLEAELLRARARLTRAEANLDGALIRAPEDGAIVRRIIQPGGSVDVGQPIIAMWLGQDVWVEAWIDEDDIGAVSLGSEASVTFHSFPGREFVGVVDKIGLATDLEIPESEVPQPRFSRMRGAPVVGVRIRLTDPPLDLLPGLSAVVAIRKVA